MTSSTSSTCMLTSISVKDEQEKETLGLPFADSCIWPTHAATAWECGKSSAAAAPKLTRPRGPYVTSRNALKGENTSFPFRLYARLRLLSACAIPNLSKTSTQADWEPGNDLLLPLPSAKHCCVREGLERVERDNGGEGGAPSFRSRKAPSPLGMPCCARALLLHPSWV